MFFHNTWRAKDKREFRLNMQFQGSTACNLIEACHCFAGNCSIHLDGRNLTLGRRSSRRLCSKNFHIPEKNIFYSYEKFVFNCRLMLYIASQYICGRKGTYNLMRTMKVYMKSGGITPFILNFGTGCKWTFSFTPQTSFNRVRESKCLPNGMLGGYDKRFERFLEEIKYLPLTGLKLRTFQPVAMSLYWPRYFFPLTERQEV